MANQNIDEKSEMVVRRCDMLMATDASKSFGGISVLSGINLTIANNTIVGLAGPSGSGKSTLLRCMQGLENIDSGIIEQGGKAGFMFQDFQLFPHMNVLQNLTYSPKLHDKTKDHDGVAMSMLKSLGIEHKAGAYPAQLSGGQKQRVALARSLMMRPNMLLCDEPTSGLDVATIMDVVSLLQSVRDTGVTMVIASHDLDFLVKISDRILLLDKGKISMDIDPRVMDDPIETLKQYWQRL